MTEQESHGSILEKELTRLGFPSGKRGDARLRGELFGTKGGVVRQWLIGRYSTPTMVWVVLKLYELLSADARVEFKKWARERAERGDFPPRSGQGD